MSLKTKFFSILTVAIGVVTFSTFTLAQDNKTETGKDGMQKRDNADRRGRMHEGAGREMHGGKRIGRDGGFGLRGINLTDAQKEQIRAIREANKPTDATIQEMRAIRDARKAGAAITPEQKERMKALREQAQVKAKSVHEQILAVLTAEQKTQIEQRKQEMKQRREEFKQKRHQKPATTEKPKVG